MQSDKEKSAVEIDLPEGVPPLLTLYFYIAGSCNLTCKHCWINPDLKENSENGKFLKPEYIRSAIQQAKPLGLRSVKLTGGEPLLHPQFREILTIIRDEELTCPIETNGTLIDDDMAQFLSSEKNKPFISVSIDGSNAQTHEELRGVEGSFLKTVNAVEYLVKHGIRPQVICTLNKKNIGELEEVVKMAEGLGCESVKFNLVQRIGRGDGYGERFGFTLEKALNIYQFVENTVVPSTRMRIEYDIPIAFYKIKRFLRGNLGKCNVFNILGILASGELSMCGIGATVPELVYGHTKNEDLKKVWCESAKLLRLRKNIPAEFEGICSCCIHKELCLGTCIANNYHRTGTFNSSHYFCEGMDKMGLFPQSRKTKGGNNG
jgi:SynChlorMet cassette radical SAM/SPASM protein ScmF